MDSKRFGEITGRYAGLKLAIFGDFCLDRYLEIDPQRKEISIETALPVHNVVNVRAQPGAAGTILNNLCALGIGRIYPVGFAGDDGEGFELCRSLAQCPGVELSHFLKTPERRTFTYCKPLLMHLNRAPEELNRLDSKNWSPTPPQVRRQLIERIRDLAGSIDAIIVLDQVDLAETGVVTTEALEALGSISNEHPDLFILADSRRGLRQFPSLVFKMNAAELAAMTGSNRPLTTEETGQAAVRLAKANRRPVFITLSEHGMLGATPLGNLHHVASLPLRGDIDIVGAGDSVSANLSAATAAGATVPEALELANAGASIVIHKLGTTGTASVPELQALLQKVS
jgi:rfaE bifunctional protein kinase chain/domain